VAFPDDNVLLRLNFEMDLGTTPTEIAEVGFWGGLSGTTPTTNAQWDALLDTLSQGMVDAWSSRMPQGNFSPELKLTSCTGVHYDAAGKTQKDAAEAAFLARLNDPTKSGGCMKKIVNLKFEQDEFPKGSGTIYRRLTLGGISQPMAKLDAAATQTKLGGLFKTLVASKDGPPKRDGDNKGGPRNPTSAPPAVQSGGASGADEPIPF